MACDYVWEREGVVKTFTGFVSGPDFVRSAEVVGEDPRFDTLAFILNDFLDIDGHGIDVECYFAVAASRLGAMRTNPNFRVLFVARSQVREELQRAVAPTRLSLPFDPAFFATLQQGRDWIAAQPRLSGFRQSGF